METGALTTASLQLVQGSRWDHGQWDHGLWSSVPGRALVLIHQVRHCESGCSRVRWGILCPEARATKR